MHTHVHMLTCTHTSPYTWCANSSFPIEAQRVLLILESLSPKKRYICVPGARSAWHPVSPWSDRKPPLSLPHSASSSTINSSFCLSSKGSQSSEVSPPLKKINSWERNCYGSPAPVLALNPFFRCLGRVGQGPEKGKLKGPAREG